MIDKQKHYRTRDGREVRIYSLDGGKPWPVHGATLLAGEWCLQSWTLDGQQINGRDNASDLIEADPHGILPRHRELLASVYEERGCTGTARTIRDGTELGALQYDAQAALIALAKLDEQHKGG